MATLKQFLEPCDPKTQYTARYQSIVCISYINISGALNKPSQIIWSGGQVERPLIWTARTLEDLLRHNENRKEKGSFYYFVCKWTTAHIWGGALKFIVCRRGGGGCSPPARENNSLVRAAPAHCPRIFSELPPSSRCFPGRVIPLLYARHLPLWDE